MKTFAAVASAQLILSATIGYVAGAQNDDGDFGLIDSVAENFCKDVIGKECTSTDPTRLDVAMKFPLFDDVNKAFVSSGLKIDICPSETDNTFDPKFIFDGIRFQLAPNYAATVGSATYSILTKSTYRKTVKSFSYPPKVGTFKSDITLTPKVDTKGFNLDLGVDMCYSWMEI